MFTKKPFVLQVKEGDIYTEVESFDTLEAAQHHMDTAWYKPDDSLFYQADYRSNHYRIFDREAAALENEQYLDQINWEAVSFENLVRAVALATSALATYGVSLSMHKETLSINLHQPS